MKVCIKTDYAQRRSPRKHHTTFDSNDALTCASEKHQVMRRFIRNMNALYLVYWELGLCLTEVIALADAAIDQAWECLMHLKYMQHC
jgi:hypothetical protein